MDADAAIADAAAKDKLERMQALDVYLKLLTITSAELKARFAKESESCDLAYQAVMNGWRDIMRLAKVEELRGAIGITAQAFERDVEARRHLIGVLLSDLQEAEEHARHITSIHMLNIDKLLALQTTRIEDLRKEFMTEVKVLKESMETERAEMVTASTVLRTEILHVMRAVREDEETKVYALEAEFAQNREALRRKSLERIHSLQTDMDSAIEILEKAFEDAHARYLSNTDQRTQDFKALSARGQHDTQMKERQKRAIRRLQARLQYAQNKLSYLVRDSESKNHDMEVEVNTLGKHLQDLKSRWAAAQALSTRRMKVVASQTSHTRKALASSMAIARRIFLTCEDIRKLESIETKTLPFVDHTAGDAERAFIPSSSGSFATLAVDSMVEEHAASSEHTAHVDAVADVTAAPAVKAGSSVHAEAVAVVGMRAVHADGATAEGTHRLARASLNTSEHAAEQEAMGPVASTSVVLMAVDPSAPFLPPSPRFTRKLASGTPVAGAGAATKLSAEEGRGLGIADMAEEVHEMERFYKRYNAAVLEKLALQRHEENLRRENEELRKVLDSCLGTLRVDPTALDAPNPLMVVNFKTGVNEAFDPHARMDSSALRDGSQLVSRYRVHLDASSDRVRSLTKIDANMVVLTMARQGAM